jgi:hypothetical protein
MSTDKMRSKKQKAKQRFRWEGVPPLTLFFLWTSIGLAFAFAWYLPSAAEGKPVALRIAMTWYLLDSYIWFCLCPLLFLIQRRYPLSAGKSSTYFVHLFLALGIAWLHFALFIYLDSVLDSAFSSRFRSVGRAFTQLFLFRTISGAVTYVLIMAVLFARNFYDGLRAEQRRSAAIEYQLAKSQLEALRMQLQPHFLFNALHSVSALIEERPRDAIRMITKLGAFLRVTLEPSTDHLVALEEEIRFLKLYFEIEQIRLGDRVRFYLEVDPETQSLFVPSLILQPLVENALKHGAWQRADSSSIRVTSRLVDKDFLKIIVRNEGGESSANDSTRIQEGLGLSNVRGRLQQLFRGRFQFDYGWVSPQVFQVSLEMPLNRGSIPGQCNE